MALLYSYINIFFCFCFLFVCLFFLCVFCVFFLRGEGRNVKSERGSWGEGRRGYIVLCIHEQKTLV